MNKEITADEQPLQGYFPLEVQAARIITRYPKVFDDRVDIINLLSINIPVGEVV